MLRIEGEINSQTDSITMRRIDEFNVELAMVYTARGIGSPPDEGPHTCLACCRWSIGSVFSSGKEGR